uniref:UDP-glucose:glycoprotein glucosyltransferase n=1 Tax=Ditylenchus dipsaci TaxID=166011 RepID=A0A915CUW8_9BILA
MDAAPEEALNTLADISQNFPIRARSLVQTKVRKVFREEVASNQERFAGELEISEGDNAFFLNGINIDVDSLDIFQLFNTISQEESLANAFLEWREYLSVLYNMDLSEDKTAYAIDYREAYPEYINDLDKDKSYREWGNSVKLLLQPYFPGMIRPIARNLFTMICVLDPAGQETRSLLKISHSLFMHQNCFVFVVDDDAVGKSGKDHVGVAILNLYNFAKSDKTAAKAIHLLTKLLEEYTGDDLTVTNVHKFFKKHFPDQDIDDVFQADSDYDTGRTAGQAFLKQSGLQTLPKVLLNGVVLDDAALQPDKIEESILMQIMRQTTPLQRAVASGKLTDKETVQNWILNQPDVLPRLNNRLLKEPANCLPVYDVNPCKAKNFKQFMQLKPHERAQCVLEKMKYLTKGETEDTKWLTIWLVGDLNTAKGRQLLINGLKALKKSNNLRLSYIHNGHLKEEKDKTDELSAVKLVTSVLRNVPSTLAKQMLNKLLSSEEALSQLLKDGDLQRLAVHGVDLDAFSKGLVPGNDQQLAIQTMFAERDLGLQKGDTAVVVNGIVSSCQI